MGAAGLAAATLVSGLSFGPAAVASDSPSRTADEVGRSIGINARYALPPTNYGVSGISENGFTLYGTPRVTADSHRPPIEAQGIINGRRYAMGFQQWPAGVMPGDSVSVVFKTLAYTGGSDGETETSDGTAPVTIKRPGAASVALNASVTRVNNIAKSAVISGTATPGAKVSIGSKETSASTTTGAWSMTVTGLKVGRNDLTVIQKINGSEHDRKTVSPTIVDGGTIVPIAQGPIDLERGGQTDVPFVVQNNDTRTNMVGNVTVTAPAGTTFATGQTTVAASYRSGTSGSCSSYAKLNLTGGERSSDGKTMTFKVNTDGGNMVSGEQYRYILKVDTPASAASGSGAMGFVYSGDSSKGDYRAQGATTTKIGVGAVDFTAVVTSVNHAAKSAVISGTATPGSTIVIDEKTTRADFETGAWTITVTDLHRGPNRLYADRVVDGRIVETRSINVDINDAAITGQDGTAVTLERGAVTSVGSLFRSTSTISNPTGTVEFTAPEGTTFSEGQGTISGDVKDPGGAWENGSLRLTNGQRSPDGSKYTYSFRTESSFRKSEETLFRWSIDVSTPADAEAGTSPMTTKLTGTATDGAFNTTSTTATTIESGAVDLVANVTSVDHAAKTAVISGTATPGATVVIGEESVEADAETGAWSITVSDLERGKNTIHVVQEIDGEEHDSRDVDVAINDAAITGQDGTAVTLERGGVTSVESLFTTNGAVSRPQAKVEFTAPEGTTFPDGQRTLNGQYKLPNGDWKAFAQPLSNGTRSGDGTEYTYDLATSSSWRLADGAMMRWNINVTTPADAEAGTFPMTTKLVGTATEGAFNTTSTTATTIEAGSSELAPITLTGPASVTPGRSNTFTGTAEPGATYRVLNVSGTQIVPGTLEVDGDGKWTFDRVVSNGASNFRFVIEQTKNGQTAKSEIFTIDATKLTPVTVTAPERVTPGRSNTFTGTGEPGATFRVLNISGTQIVPGTHEVDAQGNWTFDRVVSSGASNFRFVIEQSKNGQTEKSEVFTIEAAGLAPVTVANRSVTPGVVNTFTGTGEPGASYRVLNITGTQIVPGTFEVDPQGNWTFDRAVSRGATEFRFALEQTKNGRTELSELFTLPADTK
jgi:hypothetical protein